ncbi:MAG: hypothetical protein D6713_06770 [Deltaproteobacteria bacterium]|nr:MAG: hypothetical protein D6713_06770 [Deltaproteobacteria bacterium]
MGISPSARRRVILRSFLIQCCWSFEDMQSTGFLYAILPGLREIYGEDLEGLREAAKRHADFFNTHPYLAPCLEGLALNLEERVREGKVDESHVSATKVGLMGSLGAIGDSFFWGSVKPLSSLLGVILSFFSPLLGVLFMLIFYNWFHLRTVVRGFDAGLRGSEGVYAFLKESRFAERNDALRGLLLAFLGIYLGYFVAITVPHTGTVFLTTVTFFVALLVVVVLEFIYRKISAVSEFVVFSALFLVLITMVLR